MKYFYSALIMLVCSTLTTLAIRIPDPARIDPEVRDFFHELQQHYAEGNLYEIMQARKERLMAIRDTKARLQAMKNDVVSVKMPVICGLFADNTPSIPDFQAVMQSKLFSGPDSTMTNYYLENSYHQFEVTGTVFDWVQLAYPESIYVNDVIGIHGDMGRFIHEVLTELDKTVDFSQFDNDGDGAVENLCVIHSNTGQEYYGKEPGVKIQHIWSHSYFLKYYPQGVFRTNDTTASGKIVSIDKYTVQPEIDYVGQLEGIGVFCHEFGHVLGLPDLYDVDYNTNGVGLWCMMSNGGSYSDHCPAHFCAWSKEFLGWLSVIPITENTEQITLPPIETHPVAYKIWTNGRIESYRPLDIRGRTLSDMGKEYFLLEYRKKTHFDRHLPGEGLIISHVYNPNNNGANRINTNASRPGVKIMQADGRDDLKKATNGGDSGDPFPGIILNRTFNELSNPNSDDYDGKLTMVSVYNISDPDSVITFSAGVSFSVPELQLVQSISTGEEKRHFGGDTVSLALKIYNTRGACDSLKLDYACDDPDIQFTTDHTILKNIPTMDTLLPYIPMEFKVADQAVDKRVRLKITVSGAQDFSQQISFPFFIGYPPELLIRDNRYVDDPSTLVDGLDSLNRNFEYLDLEAVSDSVDYYLNEFAGLGRRKAIFWLCGNYLGVFAEDARRDSLRHFLDQGGNLMISGAKTPFYLSRKDSLLMKDYFHMAYDTVTTRSIIRGIANDPISSLPDGSSMILRLDTVTQNTSLQPLGGAEAFLTYWGTHEVAGVRYASGTYKVVFLSFPLENAVKQYATDSDNTMLYQTINDWFDRQVPVQEDESGPGIKPVSLRVTPFPNPFNSRLTLSVETMQAGPVEIEIYNILGSRVYHGSLMAPLGQNQVAISADHWTSGLYFYHVRQNQACQKGKIILLK
ncbi:MAG: M6 family metalloprotease domain-containing protein [Candidatus Delongbacteria bacterium]|nr:M6 family metalloprotease domain-containing protein [Candidatus Delongbacteria bacterium]